jgi:hypothetical protein
MNLLKKLGHLSDYMDNTYPLINYGGCCIFAAYVGKRLNKIVPTRVAVFDNVTNTTIDNAREYVWANTTSQWNFNGVEFGHVVVEFKYKNRWYHLDTNGVRRQVFNWDGDHRVPGSLTIKEAYELGKDCYGWNDMFPRKQIPRIRKDINKFFKQMLSDLT